MEVIFKVKGGIKVIVILLIICGQSLSVADWYMDCWHQ